MAPDTLVQTMPALRPFRAKVQITSPVRETETDIFLAGHKPRRKPAPSATHELRALRADAAAMEGQLASLCTKWHQNLPDPAVRTAACTAAKAKWISAQTEQVNRSLKDQVLQQQLYLASLQHLLTQSPFLAPSRSKELFDGLHSFSVLSETLSFEQRTNVLQAQCDLGVRLVPALMNRFARQHLHSATGCTPFSHTSVMADGHFTYVSNLLLCRIQHWSLEVAVQSAMCYFQNLSTELQAHLGVTCNLEVMQDLGDARVYSQMKYCNGDTFCSTSNTTLAARITPESAIVVADFIDQDARNPIDRTKENFVGLDSCLSLLMNLETDPVTGQEHVLVQRLSVNRYNLPPTSSRLHDEIRSTLSWFNGDLFMEVICRQLEQTNTLPSC